VYRYGLDCPTPVKISLKITPGLASCEKKGENKRQFQANLHSYVNSLAPQRGGSDDEGHVTATSYFAVLQK
ncbi:hypothetical protein PoMZ_09899, partial [Pyricularia oryzae]